MKLIKAWNKDSKIMYDNITSRDNWSYNFIYQDVFIWLLCTGRQDKNKKDIYDGDILRTPHFVDSKNKQHYLYHEVKYDNDFTGWKVVSVNNSEGESILAHGNPQLWIYLKKEGLSEVIGNIYENPELVNEKQLVNQ